ncbi:unnamed protein product [Mucor hiemalis]
MKSATLPRAEDKRIVRGALPSSKIFTAAVGRLYVSLPNGDTAWKYSGLWGAVAFCKDRSKNDSYFIRIIDMEDRRGVVWEQELYNGFDYNKDCAFFHTFATDDYLAGILFVHQGEAEVFHEKVVNKDQIKLKESNASDGRSQKSNDIGLVKYTPGKGFTVENNDPEIMEILKELEKLEDFSAADIAQNQDLVHDFIRQYRTKQPSPQTTSRRAPPPPPPPSRRATTNRSNLPPPPIPSINHRAASPATPAAPPPPPPLMNRNNFSAPPPPPVPSRGIRQTPSVASFNSVSAAAAPPPPPPPPMGGAPPPPPPPPPQMGGALPPPPAPPMSNGYTSSPSSSPIPKSSLPPSSDSRNDLMAAIRSTGGFGSLKKGGSLKVAPKSNSAQRSPSAPSLGGNKNASMASSLAAVLQQRKTAMQSDDEDDDDDDDWK